MLYTRGHLIGQYIMYGSVQITNKKPERFIRLPSSYLLVMLVLVLLETSSNRSYWVNAFTSSPHPYPLRSQWHVKALSHMTGYALRTCIAAYKHILSGGEITSPAENLRLTGMYMQRTSPNTNAFGG